MRASARFEGLGQCLFPQLASTPIFLAISTRHMGDISSLACLNESQKRALARAGVTKLGDIWLQAPSDLAKKLRLTVNETQAMIDKICAESSPRPQYSKLGKAATAVARTCTTGDAALDRALGGGIHASSVTEISGES